MKNFTETMQVKNPLSDFWKSPKDGSRLTWDQATAFFITTFLRDMNSGAYAVDEKLNKIKLGDEGATHEIVDKVAGVWRIQSKFPYEITRVRDKDMVLTRKLDRVENTLFEYYSASVVNYNCYGPFVFENCDYVVAKDNNGFFLGYGRTLEDARAFLGIKFYDEFKDVIRAILCWDKKRTKDLSSEDARAFLGMKFYEEFKDVIDAVLCWDKKRVRGSSF